MYLIPKRIINYAVKNKLDGKQKQN